MKIWSIIILIFALGCDNFTVGLTYGIRNIKIKYISLIIIGITAVLASNLGLIFTDIFSKNAASYIGNTLLIFIGLWLIYTTSINGDNNNKNNDLSFHYKYYIYQLKNPALLMKKIKYPDTIALFKNEYLSTSKTIIMSIALSFDAFSAGIGVGLSEELNYLFTFLIGIFSPLFILSGILVGKKFGPLLPDNFNYIPGFIIILIGVINLI